MSIPTPIRQPFLLVCDGITPNPKGARVLGVCNDPKIIADAMFHVIMKPDHCKAQSHLIHQIATERETLSLPPDVNGGQTR